MSYKEYLLSPEPRITQFREGIPLSARIFGVPYDYTSTYRPGSRFGPDAIREAFMNIEIFSPRLGVDLEKANINDLGNLHHTSSLEKMCDGVGKLVNELVVDDDSTIAILGGEHSLTYGSFKSMPKSTALIVFDAHLDMRDEFADLKLSHATFLRRLTEEVGFDRVVHVGARAASADEWSFVDKAKMKLIPMHTILTTEKPENVLKEFLRDFQEVYVSIDMDVIDPAFAPAVGNPEPGGLTTHGILEFLYALTGKFLRGFDIVEMTPGYDNGATKTLAARLLAELIAISTLRKK